MEKKQSNSPVAKFFAICDKIELALGGLCLAILFIVVMIGVFSRVFKFDAVWYEETTRVFFLWMMWIGLGAGFNHSESSRVTVLINLLPEFVQKICHALYYILNFALFGILIVYGTKLTIQMHTMNQMGTALKIPMWIVGACVPVGGIFGFIGNLNVLFFEGWRLKTTAEMLEADEIAAQTKAQIAAEEAAEAEKEKGGQQ